MKTAAAVKERPALFSGCMVRELMAGTKGQTRRAMNPQPQFAQVYDWRGKNLYDSEARTWCWRDYVHPDSWAEPTAALAHRCPYGRPGERLWVRETHAVHSRYCEGQGIGYTLVYRADNAERELDPDTSVNPTFHRFPHQKIADEGWRPSIFMPRWACRIVLEITDVRVERLQDISEDDAKAEGIPERASCYFPPTRDGTGDQAPDPQSTARSAYAVLWDDLNGAGAWDANPYVWVLTFKRIAP